MKKSRVVLQEGNKDCGAAALLSVIHYFGGDIPLSKLQELTKTTKEGTNFYSMSKAIKPLGLEAKCYKVDEPLKLKEIDIPYIVQLNNNSYTHFVVVYKFTENKIVIMDPAKGMKSLDMFDFANNFTGYLMTFKKEKNLVQYNSEKVVNNIIRDVLKKNINIIISLIILSIIFTLFTAVTSLYSQIVFDKIIDTTKNNLIVVTIFFSILYLIKVTTNFIRNHLIIYLNQKLDLSLLTKTFEKIIMLPFYYYKNKTTGEILSRINDLTNIKIFISKVLLVAFLDIITFITSFIFIYKIDKNILIVLILIIFINIIIIIISNRVLKVLTITSQERVSNINSYIIERVSSFETVKNLNIEDKTIYNFNKLYSGLLNINFKKEKMASTIIYLKDITIDIGMLLTSFLIISKIIKGTLTIGNYITITFLSVYLISPIKSLLDLIVEYHYIKNSIKRANSLFEVKEENTYDNHKLLVNGNIKINNLSFTYNNKNNIFENISFFIKDKDKVLILGSSGSGKSTILKLIYKYYEIDNDKIFINDYDINNYSMSDIRNNITYISQNERVYTDTIRNNIILDRNIKENEYLDVCKITYVNDIINNLPNGENYPLEENGINISGGQRQRIILARALLKQTNIIMIDEGLNEIDINLERKILKNIFDKYQDKTIIIVSHRKENMDLYNRVLIIKSNEVRNTERNNSCLNI